MAACKARALLWPLQRMSTSLAAITVPTPTVSAVAGTALGSPPKNRLLAMRVSVVSVFSRVRLLSEEKGSLKAM